MGNTNQVYTNILFITPNFYVHECREETRLINRNKHEFLPLRFYNFTFLLCLILENLCNWRLAFFNKTSPKTNSTHFYHHRNLRPTQFYHFQFPLKSTISLFCQNK